MNVLYGQLPGFSGRTQKDAENGAGGGTPPTRRLVPPGHAAVSLALSRSSYENFCPTCATGRPHLHHAQGRSHPGAASLDKEPSVPEVTFPSSPAAELRAVEESNRIRLMRLWPEWPSCFLDGCIFQLVIKRQALQDSGSLPRN